MWNVFLEDVLNEKLKLFKRLNYKLCVSENQKNFPFSYFYKKRLLKSQIFLHVELLFNKIWNYKCDKISIAEKSRTNMYQN